MKAKLTALIAAALIVVCMSSCVATVIKPEPTPEPSSEMPTPTSTPTPSDTVTLRADPARYADGEIAELYSVDGEYTDGCGNTWNYRYHLPCLTAKTKDAGIINEDIKSCFSQLIENSLKSMEEKWSLSVVNVDWEYARNGSILSLLIKADYDWAFTDYLVYHYNTDTGERLYTKDIVSGLGMSMEEFLTRARYTAEKVFDEGNYFFLTDFCDEFGYQMQYVNTRSQTLDDLNICNETQIFPDSELRVIMKIGSMAGAGWYYHDVLLEELPERQLLSYSDGFMSAGYSDGETIIKIEDVSEHNEFFDELGIIRNSAYTVHGLWSEYKDMFIASVGEYYRPYLFMTTVRGEIECVDIIAGVRGDCLCAMQLQGIGGIEALEADTNEEIGFGSVIAYDSEGNSVDLYGYILDAANACDTFLQGEWTAEYYAENSDGTVNEYFRFMDILDENEFCITKLNADTQEKTEKYGHLTYLGCTENGVAYTYEIYGDAETGVVIIKNDLSVIDVTCTKPDNPFTDSESTATQYFVTYG